MKGKQAAILHAWIMLSMVLWTVPGLAAPLHASKAIDNDTLVVSIPAAAFLPYKDGYDYQNDGRFLIHLHSPGGGTGVGWYYAPVQLPDSVLVTKFTFYWYDAAPFDLGKAILQRSEYDSDIWDNMATAESPKFTMPGYGSSTDDSIDNGYTENTWYRYWVVVELPATATVMNLGVTIEYNIINMFYPEVSIPAAAFTPYEDGYFYENAGRHIIAYENLNGSSGLFYAPVHLPYHAEVNYMTFNYYDADSADATVTLQRASRISGDFQNMASRVSYGDTGYGFGTTTAIDHPIIDQLNYSYWVVMDLPDFRDPPLKGCYVLIGYTMPAFGNTYYSVSAAGFSPHEDGYDYQNHGRFLMHLHGPGGSLISGSYYAQVQLPQGVRVDQVRYTYYNTRTSGSLGGAYLQRTHLGQGDYQDMSVITPDSSLQGYLSDYDNTIDYATIDNTQYAYWVAMELPASPGDESNLTWGMSVTIRWSYPVYLPVVLR